MKKDKTEYQIGELLTWKGSSYHGRLIIEITSLNPLAARVTESSGFGHDVGQVSETWTWSGFKSMGKPLPPISLCGCPWNKHPLFCRCK